MFSEGVLHDIYGSKIRVNSTHHQSVALSGIYKITGKSPDGVVEAFEDPKQKSTINQQVEFNTLDINETEIKNNEDRDKFSKAEKLILKQMTLTEEDFEKINLSQDDYVSGLKASQTKHVAYVCNRTRLTIFEPKRLNNISTMLRCHICNSML